MGKMISKKHPLRPPTGLKNGNHQQGQTRVGRRGTRANPREIQLRARALSLVLLLVAEPFACADADPADGTEGNILSDSQGCRSIPITSGSTDTGSAGSTDTDSASSTNTGSTNAGSTSAGSTDTGSANSTDTGSTDTDEAGTQCIKDTDCEGDLICIEGSCGLTIAISRPNVMLVLDKSGSMASYSWDDDGNANTPDVTRWSSLHSVVWFIITIFDSSTNQGMVLFPSKDAKSVYNANACLVEDFPEVPAAPLNGAAILAAMPPADASSAQLGGATPTRLAMLTAINHLTALDDGSPRFLILITDGAANCSPDAMSNEQLFEAYDDGLMLTVINAATKGMPTFVVGIDIKNEFSGDIQDGIPDSVNLYDQLNTLAIAGGVPKDDPNEKFYNSQNQIQLQDALQAIALQVLPPCVIDLTPAPMYADSVDIVINGATFNQSHEIDCEIEDGWTFVDDTFMQIRLCGEICANFRSSGTLEVLYKLP